MAGGSELRKQELSLPLKAGTGGGCYGRKHFELLSFLKGKRSPIISTKKKKLYKGDGGTLFSKGPYALLEID